MRTLKFRYWDTKNKKFNSDIGIYLIGGVDLANTIPEGYEITQFTGLTDRHGVEIYEGDILAIDFEYYGHLPKVAEHNLALRGINGYPVTVSWDNEYACFQIESFPNSPGALPSFQAWLGEYISNPSRGSTATPFVEVIGNVWEDKDLLK